MIQSMRLALVLATLALVSCTSDVVGPAADASLTETHRAILSGVVAGQHNAPLEGIEVVVQFQHSHLPSPSERTDGAGGFEFVLAMYNSDNPAADSASAIVYAISRDEMGDVVAITHKRVMIRFQPVAKDPPVTNVELALPII